MNIGDKHYYWTIDSLPYKNNKSITVIDAICCCGAKHQLVVSRMNSGKPKSCRKCFHKRRSNPQVIDGYKICRDCKENKSIDSFHNSLSYVNGYNAICKICYKYDWMKKKYNLSKEEFDEMFKCQLEMCDICETRLNINASSKEDGCICIDHCHKTGKVRGIVCKRCNTAMGFFKDDIKVMKKAIHYLETSDLINNEDRINKTIEEALNRRLDNECART